MSAVVITMRQWVRYLGILLSGKVKKMDLVLVD